MELSCAEISEPDRRPDGWLGCISPTLAITYPRLLASRLSHGRLLQIPQAP